MNKSIRAACGILALATGAFGQISPTADLRDRAYCGIVLRDNPEGAVVNTVRPGPFQGTGDEASRPQRGDLVVSANGSAVTAESFEKLIASLHPGDALKLVVRRGARPDPLAALPKGDPNGREITFAAAVESADAWTGTIGRLSAPPAPVAARAGEFENRIRDLAARSGLWRDGEDEKRLESLLAQLTRVQREAGDSLALPAIARAFARPLSVDAVEAEIARAVRGIGENPNESGVKALIRQVLGEPRIGDKPATLDAADAGLRERAEKLVRFLRDSITIGGPDAAEMIATVREARAGLDRYVLTEGFGAVGAFEKELKERASNAAGPIELPPELRGAVEGDVLYARRLEDGRYAVVGGRGPNRYRMDVVEVVYDLGGNDVYEFVMARPGASANHIIFDLAGDDQYLGMDDFCGPGVAVCGLSWIDDRGGNDLYRSSRQFSIGAGLFGVGVILDRSGNDRYENTGPESGWSEGVGFYGVGLIIDLAGDDTYLAEKLCQGVGGPFGFGAIIDLKGNDSYKANGPSFHSAYDTPGVFLSMSQGFAMGIRGYASGGIGAIYDFAGRDHYDAGEFSQGCGYYFGIGILHDFAGDDVYDGNRYSQGASAHQAVGILIDDSGNDRYTGKTAASQAGAWDQSIALLVDRSGNDVYKAEDLAQGAAAQSALAMLIDLGGSDRYEAAGGPDQSPGVGAHAQGCSGSNEYHFAKDHLLSFSLLLDTGPGNNFFSTGRKGIMKTGMRDGAAPEKSSLLGLFAAE